MTDKLSQAIQKTIHNDSRVAVSVLRPNAENFDMMNATSLVRMAEKNYYGENVPTDSSLITQGTEEVMTLRNAIDRAARRR